MNNITQTLQENSPPGIEIKLLKDCKSAIPILAQWMFEEWKAYDRTLTKERLIASFEKRLNDDKIPFTAVAIQAEEPIGLFSLKEKPPKELSDFPKDTPWLGSLYVIPQMRNKGIGTLLFETAGAIARKLNHDKLMFYTSNPENIAWYQKRGATVVETRPFRGHTITLLHLK